MSKKIQTQKSPMQLEYEAKIAATSMALSRFYSEAMNGLIDGQEKHGDAFKPEEMLEKLSMRWATNIVDDISPLESIIHV